LNRNATFTIKTGIDIYGGFKGTESRVWQRQLDEKGFPTNKTILSGDILREAIIDTNISVGDRRTAGSKANASYNVVYAAVTNYTYLNGFEIKFGNANGGGELDNGAGIYSFNSNLVNINNKLENHTATRGGWYRGSSFNSESSFVTSFGGGWYAGTNTNCTAYNNSAINGGGGWFLGTNTNCTAYNNSAINGGGGWRDGTNTNCTAYNNSASFGGGWFDGTNTNCTAYNNSATSEGGGWFLGTNTNCTAYSNSAINGGGWYAGTNSNCTAYSNSATYGGGWRDGNNTNCTAYSNSATYGGGWFDGNNTNCTAYSNSATVYGGGWYLGTNTNCTAYSNSATVNGGGWIGGNNTNCVGINNRGPNGVLIGTVTADSNINCLLFNNRNTSDVVVGFNDVSATSIKVFRNNAYDTMHPTITGAVGSDIDISTCLENVTLEQIKINVPTFVGNSTNETQINELKEFRENIVNNLRPKLGSILKGKGVNNVTYPNPTDFEGNERPTDSTIGILESE
jgi:hypothetical protein